MIPRMKGLVAMAVVTLSCGGPASVNDPFTAVASLSGTVCGIDFVATAIVIRDELMLTAAHNVAGSEAPLLVTFSDGAQHQSFVVGFDPERDIAFLSTPSMHRPPIRMANAEHGSSGEILRLIGQSEKVTTPYAAAEIVTAVGHDIYDEPSDLRKTNLRIEATVGPGFSGAPVLNSEGSLTAMVNARSRETSLVYAVTTSEIRAAFALTDLATRIETTACAR